MAPSVPCSLEIACRVVDVTECVTCGTRERVQTHAVFRLDERRMPLVALVGKGARQERAHVVAAYLSLVEIFDRRAEIRLRQLGMPIRLVALQTEKVEPEYEGEMASLPFLASFEMPSYTRLGLAWPLTAFELGLAVASLASGELALVPQLFAPPALLQVV